MRTSIKFNQLKNLSDADRIKSLAQAISFEMSKVSLAQEIAPQVVATAGGAKSVGFHKTPELPGFDRIKSFLAAKYATDSDNPILTDVSNQMEQFFHTNMNEIDLGFMTLFDFVDLRDSTHDHFDIIDTNAGLTWSQRKPGAVTKIRRNISESKTTVNMTEYSDGLGLLDRWLQFNQFWNIDEAIAEFRATYFDKMAAQHYGLLTALGAGVDESFATDDATTANNAMATILRAVKGKGYGVSQNATFYAVCAVEKVGRLEKMLTAQRGSAIVDQGTVSQPLSVRIGGIIGTTNIPASDAGWYLVLPGKKIKRGVWKDLTIEDKRNIFVSATDLVGVGQYNAAIGDSDQVRRCKYA